ncbi:MAG TPA: hypothetical protein ENH82_17325 [bacterium]|nr:hypothetical protein [bacterium]
MDKDFTQPISYHESVKDTKVVRFNHNRFIDYFSELKPEGSILDIGERNPLTKRLEKYFATTIDSTIGDLDLQLCCFAREYDIVIFSQVIEHLFNPLFCLENIKKVMHKDSILIIGTPIKPGFITTATCHFHEMDNRNFKKLIARAGFKITNWQRFYRYRNFRISGFFGIRPFIRMFYKCHSIVTCIKK